MATTVRFDADRAWLEFRLSRYEFPKVTDGADANWIVGSIKAFHPGIGPQSRSLPIYFRTDELRQLLDELQQFESGNRSQVVTDHIEQQFSQSFSRRGDEILWSFQLDDHQGWRFEGDEVAIPKFRLLDAVRELETAVREFPLRGKPFA